MEDFQSSFVYCETDPSRKMVDVLNNKADVSMMVISFTSMLRTADTVLLRVRARHKCDRGCVSRRRCSSMRSVNRVLWNVFPALSGNEIFGKLCSRKYYFTKRPHEKERTCRSESSEVFLYDYGASFLLQRILHLNQCIPKGRLRVTLKCRTGRRAGVAVWTPTRARSALSESLELGTSQIAYSPYFLYNNEAALFQVLKLRTDELFSLSRRISFAVVREQVESEK